VKVEDVDLGGEPAAVRIWRGIMSRQSELHQAGGGGSAAYRGCSHEHAGRGGGEIGRTSGWAFYDENAGNFVG